MNSNEFSPSTCLIDNDDTKLETFKIAERKRQFPLLLDLSKFQYIEPSNVVLTV